MPKGMVIYDSKTGHTGKMAFAIGKGMEKTGLDVEILKVRDVKMDSLAEVDAIVLGCPTYFANVSATMKDFIDRSVSVYPSKLENKVGAVFTSFDGIGAETALLSIIMAMLLQRMIIVGHQSGEFGAIALGEPDAKSLADCEVFGERIGQITKTMIDK